MPTLLDDDISSCEWNVLNVSDVSDVSDVSGVSGVSGVLKVSNFSNTSIFKSHFSFVYIIEVVLFFCCLSNLSAAHAYDAFGNMTAKTFGSTTVDKSTSGPRYNSYYLDAGSSLSTGHSPLSTDHYATGWRPYRPDIGRFSSLDPAGSPNGPNRYNYCGSDPVNATDPTGKYYDENGVWIPAYPGDEPTWRQWFDNILARTHRTADSAAHTVMDPISNFGNNVMMPVAKATTDPIANAGNATGAALNATVMPVVDSANTFIRENNETITGVTMGVGVTATVGFTGGASIPVMSAVAGSTAATGWTYVLSFFGVKSTAEGAYSTVTGKEAYTGEQLSKTDYAETVTETTFGIVGIGGVAKFSWAKWFGKSRVKTVANTAPIGSVTPTAAVAAKSVGALGREGEDAVRGAFDIGDKAKIVVNGRPRIPDGINTIEKTLSEVKNVDRQSFTQQLRDYSQHAQTEKLKFNLFMRADTKVTGPLQKAIDQGLINRLDIPK